MDHTVSIMKVIFFFQAPSSFIKGHHTRACSE